MNVFNFIVYKTWISFGIGIPNHLWLWLRVRVHPQLVLYNSTWAFQDIAILGLSIFYIIPNHFCYHMWIPLPCIPCAICSDGRAWHGLVIITVSHPQPQSSSSSSDVVHSQLVIPLSSLTVAIPIPASNAIPFPSICLPRWCDHTTTYCSSYSLVVMAFVFNCHASA